MRRTVRISSSQSSTILLFVFISAGLLTPADFVVTRNVINGTLVIGERNDAAGNNAVILIDPAVDSNIYTTSTIYRYDEESNSIVITGNLSPPDLFVRCSIGCHPDLVSLSEFCYRDYPPRCIDMRSKHLIVLNVTSQMWYLNRDDITEKNFFTTYDIVY